MNDLQRLDRLRRFFYSVRSRRVLLVVSILVACVGAKLLEMLPDKSFLFWVVLCIVWAAAGFILFWLVSLIAVNSLKKKLTEMYTNGVVDATKHVERIKMSSSRLLSLSERIIARRNFKDLCDISDYAFLSGPPSYLRVQFNPETYSPKSKIDRFYCWNEKNCHAFKLFFNEDGFESEVRQLTVKRECSETGEKVTAYLSELNPTQEQQDAAQEVELILNEPCVVAYGKAYENPDGTEKIEDEWNCIITWIGGNC